MTTTVYIAGPLGAGREWDDNVALACIAADHVLGFGLVPFIPHLATRWVDATPLGAERHYEDWMRWCLAWVERCDVLLRLPGESPGADREVAHAREHGVRVLDGYRGLQEFMDEQVWEAS